MIQYEKSSIGALNMILRCEPEIQKHYNRTNLTTHAPNLQKYFKTYIKTEN